MPITSRPGAAFREGSGSGIRDRVAAFVDAARRDAGDGLTLAEFASLAFDLTGLVIAAADEYRGVPGEERKRWVLAAAASLFDALLPLLPLPARLPIVSGILRSVFLAIVDGAVEALLPIVRRAAA